jgi:hypothetical protein
MSAFTGKADIDEVDLFAGDSRNSQTNIPTTPPKNKNTIAGIAQFQNTPRSMMAFDKLSER